ncbi:MAG: hypothetical protein HY869_17530 [Chloroflexi bacterium]|nr:hypothetical protein [Chloroflexota bacterium]
MKKSQRFPLLTVILLAAYVLSACGTAAPTAAPAAQQSSSNAAVSGPQVLAVEVAFSGMVEAMNGTQWVVDGKTITVEPQAVAGGSIQVGDMVKVEGTVQKDGSITGTRVHNSMALNADAPVVPASNPDATQTPAPATGGDLEVVGVIEAMTDTSVTIGGVVYQLTNLSEVKGLLAVGDQVRIQYVVNVDGTLAIRQIELNSLGDDNANDNANDDNANDDNGNDDNGNDDNGNDDNGNDDNGNDDNGNDDNGNDDNGNDDNGNDDNGNDDNGNDDNGNDDNGNDDNGNDDNGNDDNGNDDNSNDDNSNDDNSNND